MAEKRVPLRKCMGCNTSKAKKELIRVLRTPEGNVLVDKTGKQNGRGAYLCDSKDCFTRARKSKALEKALECSIPEEVYDALLKEMSD